MSSIYIVRYTISGNDLITTWPITVFQTYKIKEPNAVLKIYFFGLGLVFFPHDSGVVLLSHIRARYECIIFFK